MLISFRRIALFYKQLLLIALITAACSGAGPAGISLKSTKWSGSLLMKSTDLKNNIEIIFGKKTPGNFKLRFDRKMGPLDLSGEYQDSDGLLKLNFSQKGLSLSGFQADSYQLEIDQASDQLYLENEDLLFQLTPLNLTAKEIKKLEGPWVCEAKRSQWRLTIYSQKFWLFAPKTTNQDSQDIYARGSIRTQTSPENEDKAILVVEDTSDVNLQGEILQIELRDRDSLSIKSLLSEAAPQLICLKK